MSRDKMAHWVCLYVGEELGRYGFPEGHPFGTDRQQKFLNEAKAQGLTEKASLKSPVKATREEIERFHSGVHVDRVIALSQSGMGYLDEGDTPAFAGMYDASAYVVGSALDGLHRVMRGECQRTFQAIGGLHHARRTRAAGFCVFNDLGVVIETLRSEYKVRRVAYVDIDVHHGDGVFYSYDQDPDLIFVDLHEDGRFLYPGTGGANETGEGKAAGTKLNIPMPPGAGDEEFFEQWGRAEAHLEKFKPEFFILQCGADSLEGDPLAHLRYSEKAHAHAAKRLCKLADEYAKGRIMGFGGGGYDRRNLARAWSAVLAEFLI
ncbi:MAG TPA: acetoin utilization protein AcuC [Burkholderiales bacterium]|nr:acetoin utilization protein AcuC [Burkholderiales bacterium]